MLIVQYRSQDISIPVVNRMNNEGLIVLFKVAEVTTERTENVILGNQ